MRKIAFLIVLAALTAVAGVKLSAVRSATPTSALLEALPDGTGVAVVDFQKIAGSSLWAAINAQEKFKSAIDKAQSEMSDLGVKLSDVHSIAVVFPAAGMNNTAMALTGGFEQSDLLARLRASSKVKLTSEKYKDFDIYSARSIQATVPSKNQSGTKPANAGALTITKDDTSFVFYDANMLVTGSLDAVRASVDVKTGARPAITKNARLMDALAQNQAAAVRFALALTPAMTTGLQSSDLPMPEFSSVTLVFGTIDVASGIDLTATLRTDNAEHAKAIAERLNGLLTMAGAFLGSTSDPKVAQIAEALKTVSVINTDADVKITGSLPMQLLNSLLSSSAKKAQ
jgi:hypothetical protein